MNFPNTTLHHLLSLLSSPLAHIHILELATEILFLGLQVRKLVQALNAGGSVCFVDLIVEDWILQPYGQILSSLFDVRGDRGVCRLSNFKQRFLQMS